MNPYRIDVVDKAVDVLFAFDFRHRELSIDEVAKRVGIARSRAYRILQTLRARDLVTLDAAGVKYRLGPGAARLGLIVRSADRFSEVVLEAMHEIHRRFRETVNLAVLDNRKLVYAEILESPYPFRVSEKVGDPVPLSTTALGRAVLSAVERPEELLAMAEWESLRDLIRLARERGYTLDDEETAQGVRCVGVPLTDPTGMVFGALSVSGPVSRVTDEAVTDISAMLRAAASRIAAVGGTDG